MEGRGLVWEASQAKLDWLVIKAICDWGAGKNALGVDKEGAQRLAATNCADFIRHLIDSHLGPSFASARSEASGPDPHSKLYHRLESGNVQGAFLETGEKRRKVKKDKQSRQKREFTVTFGEETIRFSELFRSWDYDIVKVHAYTHRLDVFAEYKWMNKMYPGYQMKLQALTTLDRIQGAKGVKLPDAVHFDVLTATLVDGRQKKVYFDISSFFDRAGALMDTESAVAQKLIELYGKVDVE